MMTIYLFLFGFPYSTTVYNTHARLISTDKQYRTCPPERDVRTILYIIYKSVQNIIYYCSCVRITTGACFLRSPVNHVINRFLTLILLPIYNPPSLLFLYIQYIHTQYSMCVRMKCAWRKRYPRWRSEIAFESNGRHKMMKKKQKNIIYIKKERKRAGSACPAFRIFPGDQRSLQMPLIRPAAALLMISLCGGAHDFSEMGRRRVLFAYRDLTRVTYIQSIIYIYIYIYPRNVHV